MGRPALKTVETHYQGSVEAEQSVLGALLLENERWQEVSARVGVDDFCRHEHRLIYSAIKALCRENSPADIMTVSARLGRTGDLEAAGGFAYLGDLANNTPSAANVAAYAQIVRDQAVARRLQVAAMAIANGDLSHEAITALNLAVSDIREPDVRCLVPVGLSAIVDCDIDPTRYVVEPILPRGHVTLLGSHGGAGKSILALTLVAHVACGRVWGGLQVNKGPALYVSLEDPGELVRYRLRRIADVYGLDPGDVAAGVTVLDGSTADSVLVAEENDHGTRRLVPTSAMEELAMAAAGHGLVVLDNTSDAFDADENSRRMVRAFVRQLTHVAQANNAAVLLLAHVDKAAARYGSNGNSYSGSTAWHNSVRSRLALTEQDGGIALAHEKNNLAKKIKPIALEWSEGGVLVPAVGNATVERDVEDDKAVLAAITAAIKDGETVYTARSGSYSTLTVLKTYPELPKALRSDKARFWAALTRLQRAGSVTVETYKNKHYKEKTRLRICSATPHTPGTDGRKGARQCAGAVGKDWRATGGRAERSADDETKV